MHQWTSVGGSLTVSNVNVIDCKALAPLLGLGGDNRVSGGVTLSNNIPASCNNTQTIIDSVTLAPPSDASFTLARGGMTASFNVPTLDRLFPITEVTASCRTQRTARSLAPLTPEPFTSTKPLQKTLTVTAAVDVSDLMIDVDIPSATLSTLQVSVTSPEGRTLRLWDQRPSGFGNQLVTTFPEPTAPEPGSEFGKVFGQNAKGDWTLDVTTTDKVVGAFSDWAITIGTVYSGSITAPLSTGAASILVPNMLAGSAYSCSVSAVNALNMPLSSDTSLSVVTPPSIVAPPVIQSIEEARNGVEVAFEPADLDGWLGPTSYTLTCGDVSKTVTSSPALLTGVDADESLTCQLAVDNGFELASSDIVTFESTSGTLSIPLLYIANCRANPQPGCPSGR